MTTTETIQAECCPICLRTSRDGRPCFTCETTYPGHTPMFEEPDREYQETQASGHRAYRGR